MIQVLLSRLVGNLLAERILEPVVTAKSHQAEQSLARLVNVAEPQHRRAPGGELLAGLSALSGDAHALLLSRAVSAQPASAARLAQQMQRRYGNRHVQRVVGMMRTAQGAAEATPEVEAAIAGARGGGQALDSGVRVQMEAAFGADFRGVRVHTGGQADALNCAVDARAFTTGRDIFFRAGEYNPQSSGGRELLAHELTHVVQQTGAVRRKLAISQPGDVYEQEADRVARAVMQREASASRAPARIPEQTGSAPRLQRQGGWFRGVVEAVGGAVANVRDRAVNYLREHARSIPGYDLLAVILGRDPITQRPVERNATNLVRGLLGLIPGGAQMFENLQQARVLERAFAWVQVELERLNLTWGVIRTAIDRFLGTMGAGDLLDLGGVLDRARAIFGPIVGRVIAFARAAGSRVLEFIFEGALALGGAAAQRVLGIFRRIGATFSLIVNDPVRFLQNLINAVAGGFRQFGSNILTHLRTAIFDWLFGALQGAGLQLPQRFDLRGIVSIILQILGLTYARLRERLVRLIGERPVQILEGAFEFLRILVTQGLAAAWEKILEFSGNLADTVIESIKGWIRTTIVGQAIQQIASLLTPAGAIIQAIIKVYNTVMFVIERAQQIAAFVQSVLDSIDNIARGNIGAAVTYVERTLARILPLVISFLARFIGLGGISGQIRQVVQRIRNAVDSALDRVINWIATTSRRLWSGAQSAVGAVVAWWRARRTVAVPGEESHTLSFAGEDRNARLIVESTPLPLDEFIARLESDVLPPQRASFQTIAQRLLGLGVQLSLKIAQQAPAEQISATLDGIVVGLRELIAFVGNSRERRGAESRNVAIAYYNINGRNGTLAAISGEQEPEQFGHFQIRHIGHLRHVDAEAKLLEQISQEFSGKPLAESARTPNRDIVGEVFLTSDFIICQSCALIILQFNQLFPRVRLRPQDLGTPPPGERRRLGRERN